MKFASLLDSFNGLRAVVIGDVMLDEYILGTVDRISPEAPVMVVRKSGVRWVPGGAANVAMNIAALGGEVSVVGVIGNDEGGKRLSDSVNDQLGLSAKLTVDSGRVTTKKTRIVANHSHQVLRIDEEESGWITSAIEEEIFSSLNFDQLDLIVLSDYLKGVLTPHLSTRVIEKANEFNIPIIVNGKPASAHHYSGSTLLTLNRTEASLVHGDRPKSLEHAREIAEELYVRLKVNGVLVTMGEMGMSAAWRPNEGSISTAPEVEAYDVAGAGDTVLATIALGIATEGLNQKVFDLAVEMGAKVVQHIGVAIPTAGDLDSIRSL